MIRVSLATMGALALLLGGCAATVASRYQYSCTLDDQRLQEYGAAFSSMFPEYDFDSFAHGCEKGLAQGVRLRGGGEVRVPGSLVLEQAGCVRYTDQADIEKMAYECNGSEGRFEVTFEDEFAYVYPLVP